MNIVDNLKRIKQGKENIITTLQSKGVNVPSGVLINEIAPYIDEIQGGGEVPDTPTDTDTYNRLNFTNISGKNGTLTIQDKVDISNMEYSTDSYTFSKVEERMFTFPKNATIYLKWEGDCNLDKGGESNFFTTNIDTMVYGVLRNGDIDRAYRGLFYGVGSIKDVSNLIFKGEYLGEQSIASAFRESGITKTPTIEATKFGVACFDACYMQCGYLQKATKFKVEECQSDSFLFMYRGCPNLHNVEIETNQWDEGVFREWLLECSNEGYLYSNFENIPTNTESGLPYGWKRKIEIVIAEDELVEHNKDTSDWDYLVFKNDTSSYDDIKINSIDTFVDKFEYSTDGGETFYYANRNLAPLYPNGETIIRWEGKLNQPYIHDSFNYERVFHIENVTYDISGELKHGNEPYNYACMFKNEWWLISAENLRLTSDVVGESAYELLFYGCGNLQIPPQITTTTVYYRGCHEMFSDCSALNRAPELTATILYDSAYVSLFRNCSSINYVKIAITDWDTTATENWLSGNIASEGTIETNANNIPNGSSGVPNGWTVKPIIPEVTENEDILIIENVDTVEGTVKMNNPNNIAIQYSTDGSEFNEYTTETEIPFAVGEKIYFKWSEVIGKSSFVRNNIVHSSVKYKVYGELKKGNERSSYRYMFINESNLIDASGLKLTATELEYGCYESMFQNCTSLLESPQLPATNLALNCYYDTFNGCTSLTTSPQLPATELTTNCYGRMFRGCSQINHVKHNITDWDISNTTEWLSNVAPSGVVECPIDSNIPSYTADGIPNGWSRVNI